MGDLDFVGEGSITMRNINSTLQKTENGVSPGEGKRDATGDILERDVARGFNGIDAMNLSKAVERGYDLQSCETLRHRKRKQENLYIHRVSSECAPNNQPLLREQDTNGAQLQQCLQNSAGDLQACDFPEISRNRKRKRELSKVHEVGLDISLRTDASHSLQALGFDISLSSSVAVAIKHASCSILPEKDTERAMGARLGIGVVNNNNKKREERVEDVCKEVRGTTVEASGVSNKDVCSMSTTKKSGQKTSGEFERSEPVSFSDNSGQVDELGATVPSNWRQGSARLEEVCLEGQRESQKLRMAALHSQIESLHNVAESGSK
ncbi:hypothetical protein L7F22_011435 [Adiantum nelumboides]|nr:hypothetical protein [Adiantum nelumboides]